MIRVLADTLDWVMEDHFFAGIGCPNFLMILMSEVGRFMPVVSKAAKKIHARKIRSIRSYRCDLMNLPPEDDQSIQEDAIEI